MPTKTLACIVAYRPDADFWSRIELIRPQVQALLIVDNSEDASLEAPQEEHALLLRNRNKGGIAGALNAALDHARSHGFSHLCFFDHDSSVPAGMVPRMVAHLEEAQGALIGPIYVNSSTGRPGRFVVAVDGQPRSEWIKHDRGVVEAFFIITSGTVVALDRLDTRVRYDESMLVDMVDVEFCLRVRQSGGRILLDTGEVMAHGMGNREEGASRFAPPNYSEWRYRMIVGNRILIWRRWFRTYPRFVLLDVVVMLADLVRNTLLLKNRMAYLRAVWRGLSEGVTRPLS